MTPSYDDIQRDLAGAVQRALEAEAGHREISEPPGLFERAARDPGTGTGDLRELFGGSPPLALVAFDTPGIQDYVFKVSRPVDVFGGSQLVADFTDRDISKDFSLFRSLEKLDPKVPPEAVVYAGGGGGLILMPVHQLKPLLEALTDLLSRKTKGDLWTAAAAVAVWPGDLDATPAEPPAVEGLAEVLGPLAESTRYAATTADLFALLGRQRSRRQQLGRAIPFERHGERCSACGERPGKAKRHADGSVEYLCPACDVRRGHGSQTKKVSLQAKTFADVVRDLPVQQLAVLYADGANVGAAFQQLGSPAQHRALSQAVDAAFDRACNKAIDEIPVIKDDETFRTQTPIRGGDDLVLVLPATSALAAARVLMREVERAFDLAKVPLLRDAFAEAPEALRRAIAGFGIGIGIAIADHHFPVSFLLAYAKDLMKHAKKHLRAVCRADPGQRSAVDFMVLTSGSPLAASIAKLRERHYQPPPAGGEPGRHITRRPYTREAFESFLQRAALLRAEVPRSQIHALRQELPRGYALSRSLWRYQMARARDGAGWAAYREAAGVALADVDSLLWQPEADGWVSTDLLDAVEVLDLVDGGATREEAA